MKKTANKSMNQKAMSNNIVVKKPTSKESVTKSKAPAGAVPAKKK